MCPMLTTGHESHGPRWQTPHGSQGMGQSSLETPAANKLSTSVVVMGRYQSRPKKRNCRSPGKRPKPIFRNQGIRPLNKISAKKTTSNQRHISAPLECGQACAQWLDLAPRRMRDTHLFYRAWVRSPCSNPMGVQAGPLPSTNTLNNSPISCSCTKVRAVWRSALVKSSSKGSKPQLSK